MQTQDIRALITGGGTGIGLEIARRIVAGGGRAVICGRRQEPLDAAAAELGVVPVQADVAVEADVIRAVSTTVTELGGLNVLVNNAAVGYFGPLAEIDAARFAELLSINVVGAAIAAREAARHMTANGGGTIVNVGSTASNKGYAGGTAYSSSKFALSSMTECWRAELRKHDIRVMQVNPSEVQTGFGGRGSDEDRNASKLRVADVAHLVMSLLSLDDRGFVTDATLWATNPS